MSVRSELRAQAMERDQYVCRWPNCITFGYPLQMAHLKQSSQGGPDTLDNVVMLCPTHHDVLDNRVVKGRRAATLDLLTAYLRATGVVT